ncbi:prenyltransferase [Flavobacterium crassostreae]|uniref:Prenyltransferase n=2 Tax=Flavobacterium crassostreae TaxID=1763534 RepID=A0A1B9E2J9_9FLAO|nr:prenyltransferase [Flavobacterium crassostreae]
MLAFMQLLFRYGFLNLQNIPLALTTLQYLLLVLSTVLLAAAGYVINNIFDQDTDLTNKPQEVIVGQKISETNAYTIYMVLNSIGVAIGFYLSNVINKPSFAVLFILIAATLYLYASSLKQMAVIGNLVVAILLSFSILIIGIFDLFPAINPQNQTAMASFFAILIDYAVFAFMINFIREIVKDLEDHNGDYQQAMRTLPIVLGIQRTQKIVFVLSCIPIICLLVYSYNYLVNNHLFVATAYSFVALIGPMAVFSIKILTAKTQKDFNELSTLLKWILFFGIVSIAVITFNIQHHA